MAKFTKNIAVCLDNEEATIRPHTGNFTPPSCKVVASFQGLRDVWQNRLLTLVTSPGTVISACNEPTLRIKASISRATRLLNERYEANITSYWENKAPERYKYLNISINPGLLLSARSAHDDYAAYHRRFKHDDATLLSDLHKPRPRQSRGPEGDIKWVFGTDAGARAFGSWCKRA
ncbi:hypothetical protein EPUL_000181 [Erysiphe pulchra]|uniref:Uncharacterized protein n=1 Tax=Erysiphe pulchra TaxID=225359 RepID=A0A2S4Q1K1_9PEZI|nr:hypothetical protein EPUL_000181 [Erysiphe pulchra]